MLELSWFVCGFICFIVYTYLFNTMICQKNFVMDREVLFLSFLLGLIYFVLTKFNMVYIRPYVIHIYFLIIFKILYKESFSKNLVGLISIIFLVLISELICGIVISIFLNEDVSDMASIPLISIALNLLIYGFCLFLSKVRIIKKFIQNIIRWQNKNEIELTVFIFILLMVIVTFILYNNFIKLLPSSFLLITNLFCIGVFAFVLGFFKEKTNNNRIKTEYEQLLNYVKVYEKTIEEKSKNQHEYKNQLILIKGMLNKNNKKASNYIDDIICNQSSDDNLELLRKLQYLPQGGLKGLIYYKVEEMISNGIDVYIDISPKLNKPKVTKIINENLHDLSKIIGVYLDNAIEAVRNIQDKYIIIEANIEKNNIIFSFSNTYNGHIDLVRLDKEGYTTKGQGKGYGLSLVKDIINNNETFEQSRQINGPYYVQKLYIKK